MRLLESDAIPKIHPPDMCTTDHLDHKWSPERGTYPSGKVIRHVAACRQCNMERGLQEEIALTNAKQAGIKPGMIMIHRYVLFTNRVGWSAYKGEFTGIGEAIAKATEDHLEWFEVVDLMTKQIVATERGITKAGQL